VLSKVAENALAVSECIHIASERCGRTWNYSAVPMGAIRLAESIVCCFPPDFNFVAVNPV